MTQENKNLPTALIYTHSLLEGSMTFIKSQAEALRKFAPVYVGSHRVDGIALPEDSAFAVNNGGVLGLVREAFFRKFGYAPHLYRELKRMRPRIVHAHFGTCGPSGMAIAQHLDIPFVVTFHGQDATMTEAEARKSIRGREMLDKKDAVSRNAGRIIAVSEYIQQCLLDQGYPEEKVQVHRNGIDIEFFQPDRNDPRDPIILFVGRFVEKKGVKYLLEAAQHLMQAGKKFELVIIGGGPLESEFKDTVEKAKIPCRFLGFLPIEGVRDWLQRARVVAVPSVVARNGDSEGLPTNILEAQAMQTPVVATRHSGIPEGVIDGTTASLVDEKDVPALAAELARFLESAEMARAYGVAGRTFVSENFDMRTQVALLEEIFIEVCKGG